MSKLLAKAVSNSKWTAVGSIGSAVLGLLFAGVTIRWLGEAEAGFAIAVSTVAGINGVVGGLGLAAAATRWISKAQAENDTETIRSVSGLCLAASLAFGSLGLVLMWLGAPLILQWTRYEGNAETGRLFCVISGLTFLFSQISAYSNTLLAALQRFDSQTKLSLSMALANGVIGIILIRFFPTILVVASVSALVAFIRLAWGALILHRALGFLPLPAWNPPLFSELWSFGKWSYFSSLFSVVGDGLDKVLITSMFGGAILPLYTIPQRIYVSVHTMLNQQCSYIFPMLVPIVESEPEAFAKIADRYRWFVGAIAGLLYGLLFLSSKSLISFVVTTDFAERAAWPMAVFCVVGFFHALGIVNYQVSYAKGDSKSNFYYLFWNATIGLPLMYLIGRQFGFKYCVLGQLSLVVSTYLHFLRVYRVPPVSGVIRFLAPHFSVLAALGVLVPLAFYNRPYSLKAVDGIAATAMVLSIAALLYTATVFVIEKAGNSYESRVGTILRAAKIIRKRRAPVPA